MFTPLDTTGLDISSNDRDILRGLLPMRGTLKAFRVNERILRPKSGPSTALRQGFDTVSERRTVNLPAQGDTQGKRPRWRISNEVLKRL